MLLLRDVSFEYPRFTLGPISLELGPGARVALVGRNGAGKSTLLGLLAGQQPPSAGTIAFMGALRHAPDIAVKQRVAFASPEVLGCPWMTASEHFRWVAHFHDRWSSERALDLARAVALPMDTPISALSRGNGLKLVLAAAWGQQADLLLLDEPTAGLDPVARAELLAQLSRHLRDRPEVALVMATHVLEDLDAFEPTHLITLRDGRGTCAEVAPGTGSPAASALARRFLLEPTE
jgi:ABC-2 type transport system ATP-binding protein